MYPMIICGIWMMVISFIHPVGSGYRAFAMMLIFVYPCVYFVWNNRGDYEKLFDPLARAVCMTGILFFLFSFYLASKGMLTIDYYNRCSGLMENANMFSMVGMVASCGALYLLVKDRMLGVCFFLYSLALGMGIAIVIMGQSRLSIIVCTLSVFVTLFFYFRYSDKSKASIIIIKLVCIVGIVVSMLLLSNNCVNLQKNVEMQNNAPAETTQQISPESAQHIDDNNSLVERIEFSENATLDTYTAGRYHIWRGYMQFMNLVGNDFSKSNWDILTQNTVVHAHNNFIEMAYRFGIPLGILFISIEVFACLKVLQYLFLNRQKQIVLLLPIIFVVMFLFESMFDIATLPFERDAPFYFYMALVPIVDLSFKFKDKTHGN